MQIRGADQRGVADLGWLHSKHSFSFGEYYDPSYMGYGPLRVINEDIVQPGKGFGTHGHRDMEIISYVIEGALEHKDNLGTGSIIRPGDIQRMSAGSGVMHSEFNASDTDPVHFLQIWIQPAINGIEPGYEQLFVAQKSGDSEIQLIGSPDDQEGTIKIHQDVYLYRGILQPGQKVSFGLDQSRLGWLQMIKASIHIGDHALMAGDGASLSGPQEITLLNPTSDTAEFLLFDMTNSHGETDD